MTRATSLLLLGALGALGCGPEFEKQATLTSLRVLGVRKDQPYAKPGATVKLSMLYEDASFASADAAPPQRDVKVLWFSACENPSGDIYLGCLPLIASTFEKIANAPVGSDPCVVDGKRKCGFGVEYSFQLSDSIIADHGHPPDNSELYGLEYVFFLVCAGDFGPAPAGQQFPLGCFSKSGKQLGADDYIVGYTEVYAYYEFTNNNPIVTGFTVGKKSVTPLCTNEACIAGIPAGGPMTLDAGTPDSGGDAGSDDAGSDASAEAGPRSDGGSVPGEQAVDPCQDPDGPACFEVCTAEKQSDCPEHDIKLETDPNTVEPDAVANKRENRDDILEQAWINYYTDQGEFVNDVKLLGDATEGYQENHGTKIKAPKKLGPFNVWGVAHDSRGGVGWAKVRLATRKAK